MRLEEGGWVKTASKSVVCTDKIIMRQNLRKTKIKEALHYSLLIPLFFPNYLQPKTLSLRNFDARKGFKGNRSFVPTFPTR